MTLGRGTSALDHATDDVAPPYSIMEHPPLAAFVNGTFSLYLLSWMPVNLALNYCVIQFLVSFHLASYCLGFYSVTQ